MAVALIAGGIIAGGMLGSAVVGGKASKDAAKTQAAAAEKALEEQRRQYDINRTDQERLYQQQRTDEAPYLALGGGAVGALTHGLGITPTPPKTVAAPTMTSPGAPIPTRGTPINPRINQERGAAGGAGEGPRGPMRRMVDGPGPAGMPLAQPGGGVPMRAPNGQTQMVPPDQVAHYTQLGAQVV